MARKFGLGRGLSALIPEEIFGTKDEVKDESKDEIKLNETDVAPPVEQPEAEVPVEPDVSVESEPQPSPFEGEGSPLEVSVEMDVPVEPDVSVEMDVSVEPDVLVEPEPQPSPLEGEGSLLDVSVETDVSVELDVPVEPDMSDEAALSALTSIDYVPVEPDASVEPDAFVESDVPVEPEVPVSNEGGDLPLSRDAVVQIAVDKLVPNPSQPRKNFDETELQELADSIKEHGVIMPIIAADTGDGSYTIIAGERRTRAARLAGLEDVPVIIRDYTDLKRMEVSLIENIQRSDLNPIEEATAYKNLMDFSSLSQGDLAARVGKNRSTVTNALRLLKLSAEVQKSLETGDISSGHARALLSVTDKKQRNKLFMEITAKGLSVREAEKKATALNSASEESGGALGGGAPDDAAKEKASKRPPEITEMEEKFIEKLGTKVTIDGGLEKGRIHIEYYSMEDLDRLYGLLGS